ncbi:MAG TPA: hypothetical protein VM008_12685 [Phycisphaerae bacterium]|nr:hypothetical protein [Phycisphaerae bacterium]
MAGRFFEHVAGKAVVEVKETQRRSRTYRLAEPLESRVLLAASLAGDWEFAAAGRAGVLSLDATGIVLPTNSGWNTFNDIQTVTASNGTLVSTANLTLQNESDTANGTTSNLSLTWKGEATPAADVIAFNDVTLSNTSLSGVSTLSLAVLNTASFSSSDLVGNWTFSTQQYRASFSIAANGHISGSLTYNAGNTINLNGTAAIASDGSGTLDFSTGETLDFVMNNSKDTINAQTQDFGLGVDTSDFGVGVKNGSGFVRDTVRGGWSFNTTGGIGHVSLGTDASNPNLVSGSITRSNGALVTISGSYRVNSNGTIEMDLAYSDGVRQTLTGGISAYQGDILLNTSTGSNTIVLISDPNRPARNEAVNVQGAFGLYGVDKTGSLTLNGSGSISAGSYTQAGVLQVVSAGTGSTYDIVPGTATLQLTTQPNGTGVASVSNWAGGVNSRGDLLAVNELGTSNLLTTASSLDLLIGHSGTFSNSAFAGLWTINAQDFRGSLSFASNGHITGGSITLNNGEVQKVTGGSATIDSTGVGSLTIVTSNASIQLAVTMGSGKNIILGNSPNSGELTVMVKSSGTYASNEIAGTTWRWAGVGTSGSITLNAAGAVNGSLTTNTGQLLHVSGKFQLNGDGSVILTLSYSNGVTQTLVGRINSDRNTIALDTTGGAQPSQNSNLVVLVNDTNHAPLANTQALLTAPASQHNAYSISYNTLLAATGAIDREGSQISFIITSVGSGALLTVTSSGATSNVVPGATTLVPGDTITWTPPANANGKTIAFTVIASDGQLLAANTTQVIATVNPLPLVKASASRSSVNEAQAGSSGASTSIVISRSGAPTTQAVTVRLSIGGTGTLGTNFTLRAPNGTLITSTSPTVTIPAGQSSAALTLTAISDGTINPTLNVIVRVLASASTTSPTYLVASNANTSVSILDGAPTLSVRTTVSNALEATLTPGEFTVTRSNTAGGPLAVTFATTTRTGSSTLAVQGTDYVLKDSAGHILTNTFTFATGQSSFNLFVVPLSNGAGNVTLSATLNLIATNSYHVQSSQSLAIVNIIDVA